MSLFWGFLKQLHRYRAVIATMAMQEIRNKYAATLGGALWAVINPLLTILVYWFVFSHLLIAQPVGKVSYLVYFCAGLIPWLTMGDTLTASTNAITANRHLVKKMVFPTEILPVVYLVTNLITHSILLVIFLIILWLSGVSLSIFNLQVLYYVAALSTFSVGLSWMLSSISVFFRDTAMILGVFLNIWFWFTPVIWIFERAPTQYVPLVKFNPMFYIIDGYRGSFVYHVPFWQNYGLGIYFWVTSLALCIVSGIVFRRLKPEFADVI